MTDYTTQRREAMLAVAEIEHIGRTLVEYGIKEHGGKILNYYEALANYSGQFFDILERNGSLRERSSAGARGLIRIRVDEAIRAIKEELKEISTEATSEQVALRMVLLPDCENAMRTLTDIIKARVKEQ